MSAQPLPSRPTQLAWAEGSLRLAAVVRTQQDHLQALLLRLKQTGADDVHQGRVAARRLRSVLKTFAPLFDARWARLYRTDLRNFARGLATVREADVHGDVLQDAVRGKDALKAAELARLSAALSQARADEREHLRTRSGEQHWKALVKVLTTRSEQPPRIVVSDATLADVLALANGAWRKPVKKMRRHPEAAEELHELRLALKHCRYALEVVADATPEPAALLLRRLRRAQDAIGAHRDTMAAAHWVRSHERTLGRTTALRIEALLAKRELRQRRAAARQSDKVLPAYEEWRAAIRPLTQASHSSRA
ncbi:MAG TPA: CHAD domain-containing protein [Steroidobacteraceae bacterium]